MLKPISVISDTQILYLSPSVKLIEGLRAFCLLNSSSGEYVLVNKDAVDILKSCISGQTLKNLLNRFYRDKNDVTNFIYECLTNNILILNKPKLAEEQIITQQPASSLSLTLELTHYCNLKCLHCYNESEKSKKTEILSFEYISQLLTELKPLYTNFPQLTISGGEPFSYKKLKDVIDISLTTGFQKIRINTNGTIFPTNQKLIDTLKANHKMISLQISLLGTDSSIHDTLTSVKGSFEKTLSNIPRFVKIIPQTKLSFLNSSLSKNLEQEAKVLSETFCIPYTINKLISFGRAVKNKGKIQPKFVLENTLHCNEKYSKSTYGQLRKEQIPLVHIKFPPELPCGKETLNVFWNGDVFPCTLLRGIKIGNVKENSIEEIVGSRKMAGFRKEIDIDNKEICKDCEIRYFCSFKCPALPLSQGKSIHDKSPQCKYY